MKVDGIEVNNDDAVYGPFVIQRGWKIHTETTDEAKKGECILDDDGNRIPNLIGFWGRPVWTMEEFDDACPFPEPLPNELVFTPKGKQPDYKHPEFLARKKEYSRKRWGYLLLKTLEPSNVEFEGASLDDPSTWGDVEEAIKKELPEYEFKGLLDLIYEANAIDPQKQEANRNTFLSQRRA